MGGGGEGKRVGERGEEIKGSGGEGASGRAAGMDGGQGEMDGGRGGDGGGDGGGWGHGGRGGDGWGAGGAALFNPPPPPPYPPPIVTHLLHPHQRPHRGPLQPQLLPHRPLRPLQQRSCGGSCGIPKTLLEPGAPQHHLQGQRDGVRPPRGAKDPVITGGGGGGSHRQPHAGAPGAVVLRKRHGIVDDAQQRLVLRGRNQMPKTLQGLGSRG